MVEDRKGGEGKSSISPEEKESGSSTWTWRRQIPDILQNNSTAPCCPPNFPGLLATLNLFQTGRASGNKLLFRLQATSLFPSQKALFYQISQPAHPEVGGATDKDATTNPPPPPQMRKFKQRLVIYPRLCQAPPQGQLGTAAPFTLSFPCWPACTEPQSNSSHSPEAFSHSLHSLSSAPIHGVCPHVPEKAPPSPRSLSTFIFVEAKMREVH